MPNGEETDPVGWPADDRLRQMLCCEVVEFNPALRIRPGTAMHFWLFPDRPSGLNERRDRETESLLFAQLVNLVLYGGPGAKAALIQLRGGGNDTAHRRKSTRRKCRAELSRRRMRKVVRRLVDEGWAELVPGGLISDGTTVMSHLRPTADLYDAVETFEEAEVLAVSAKAVAGRRSWENNGRASGVVLKDSAKTIIPIPKTDRATASRFGREVLAINAANRLTRVELRCPYDELADLEPRVMEHARAIPSGGWWLSHFAHQWGFASIPKAHLAAAVFDFVNAGRFAVYRFHGVPRLSVREDTLYVNLTGLTDVYRVFNDGSLERGGRLYGCAVRSLPASVRAHLLLNGEPVVEVDFRGHHLRLAYHLEGLEFCGDPYDIDVPGIDPEYSRALVKLMVQVALNAPSPRSAIGAWTKGVGGDRLRYGTPSVDGEDLYARVLRHHEPIRRLFGTGAGTGLQFVDSQLIIAAHLRFIALGVPMLSVHDSAIVPERFHALACEVLRDVYSELTGFEPELSPEPT